MACIATKPPSTLAAVFIKCFRSILNEGTSQPKANVADSHPEISRWPIVADDEGGTSKDEPETMRQSCICSALICTDSASGYAPAGGVDAGYGKKWL